LTLVELEKLKWIAKSHALSVSAVIRTWIRDAWL
jgi:hypothetical protein